MRLEYRPFSLALREPLGTAADRIDTREGFLVRVREDGVVGIGEATPLPGWTESLSACEDGLERAADAVDSGSVEGAVRAVEDAPAARHGLTLALADAQGRDRALPLYRFLAGPERVGRVPVNATIGDGTPAAAEGAARHAVEDGFRTLKLKVGAGDLDRDLRRLRAVRTAVGREVELRADANGAWGFDRAREAIVAFAELGISLVEQPLPADELEGHAALRGLGPEIAVDEGVLHHGIDAVIEAEAVDAVVLKPMALGGVGIARELATWAGEAGVEPIVTTTIDGAVARTGAIHLAAAIPDVGACGLATAGLLAEDLCPDPAPIDNGAAVVPQAKGLGVPEVWEP